MIRKFIVIALLIFSCNLCYADEQKVIYEGGLWNIDYPEDFSIYGHFKLIIEKDLRFDTGYILRVEWIENLDSKGERIFGSILITELSNFLGNGNVSAKTEEVPSIVILTNQKKQKINLNLFEPTRYSIEEPKKKTP